VRIDVDVIDTALGPVRSRRYVPAALSTPRPTEVFLHGGGFVSGSIDELINDALLTARADEAGIQIVSPEYRLAPEHPYPAAVEDVVAVLDTLHEQPSSFAVDVSRIGIGGASAGAGIAASATLHLRDRGDSFLAYQALEVPAVALEPFGTSAIEYARGYGLDGYEALADLYFAQGGRAFEYAQPLFARDFTGLPPAHIHVAEYDPLRDAGVAYGERLAKAGVPTVVDVGHGHVHGSPGLTKTFAAARSWQRRSAAAARTAYHPKHV
jgi:acetyl esterase